MGEEKKTEAQLTPTPLTATDSSKFDFSYHIKKLPTGCALLMALSGDVKADAGKLVASPFLVKTYRLVDDPSTDHIVSWGGHNDTFVVWRPKEFSVTVLPYYFRHANFSSFVRQLNTYGFRKIFRGRCEFGNKLFRKGQTHLLSHIQRRKPSTTSTTQTASQKEYDKAPAAPSLSKENEILRRNNLLLRSEIARLQTVRSRNIILFSGHKTRNPPLIDMDRSRVDNPSRSSSMADVAEEIRISPPKLFGVPLY